MLLVGNEQDAIGLGVIGLEVSLGQKLNATMCSVGVFVVQCSLLKVQVATVECSPGHFSAVHCSLVMCLDFVTMISLV